MFSGVKIKLIKNPIKHRLVVVFCLLLIVSLFTLLMYEVKPRTSEAGTGENVYGYAWSSNIGWIKFNDCETPSEGGTCSAPNFGVNLNPVTYQLSRYAWSNNVGWLRFDAPDPGGRPRATFDSVSGKLRGWARFCAAAPTPATCDGGIGPGTGAGGWDGWVSLNCEDGGDCVAKPYSVSLSGCDTFSGYAWGGDVVGWIKFRSEAGDPQPFGVGVSNLTLPPPPPTNIGISNLGLPSFYCPSSPHVRPTFVWDYNDPCGVAQTTFRIQVADDNNGVPEPSDFTTGLVYDTCDAAYNSDGINTCIGSYSSPNYTPTMGVPELEYSRISPNGYVLRVKVFNPNGGSGWSTPVMFDIASPHAWPDVSFTYSPNKPFIQEPITFDATATKCYVLGGDGKNPDPLGCASYRWDFGDGTVESGEFNVKIHSYTYRGNYTTDLGVTDNDGNFCSDSNIVPIGVQFEIPDWREIAP